MRGLAQCGRCSRPAVQVWWLARLVVTLATLVPVLGAALPPRTILAVAAGPLAREPLGSARHAAAPSSPLAGAWKRLVVTAPQPTVGPALAWDGADGVMFRFGSSDGDGLWAYRPAATRGGPAGWIQLTTAGAAPAGRSGASLVWDVKDGVLLLFDGTAGRGETDGLWAYKPGRGVVAGRGGAVAGRWVDVTSAADPLRRAYHAAVWDSNDGVMLVFGGDTNGTPHGDTWAYRPARGGLAPGVWTPVTVTGPAPRQQAMAAWDAVDGVMLLAGGDGYTGPLADLWAFYPIRHGASGRWMRLAAATPLGPRAGGAAAWDSGARRLLVFGGRVPLPVDAALAPLVPATRAAATATGAPSPSPTNTTVAPTATPSPTATATATATPTSTPVPPTPITTPTTTPTDTATSTPSATATATATAMATAMAMPSSPITPTVSPTVASSSVGRTRPVAPRLADPGAQRTLPRPYTPVTAADGGYTDDLWAYTPVRHATAAGTWRALGRGGPPARTTAAIVYDDTDHALMLHGGQGLSLLSDVWSYATVGRASGRWSLRDGGQPQRRAGQAGAWDSRHGALFIFGGYSGTWLNDLWAYKPARGAAGRWAALAAPNGPSARSEASLVWDNADGVLLLFGGANGHSPVNDVWAYAPAGDGTATGRWTLLRTAIAPLGRHLHTAVWDPADHQMLVYAGEANSAVLRDLWAFRPDGLARGRGTWSLLMLSPPPSARYGQSAVWDAARGRMLVFGGVKTSGEFQDDLWAYQPTDAATGSWTALGVAGTPDGRATASAAWDSVDDALVLFGGTASGSLHDDTYAYHPGNGWSTLHPRAAPDRRSEATTVLDTVGGGVLLFGGLGSSGGYNDLWQLGGAQASPHARQAHRSARRHKPS